MSEELKHWILAWGDGKTTQQEFFRGKSLIDWIEDRGNGKRVILWASEITKEEFERAALIYAVRG